MAAKPVNGRVNDRFFDSGKERSPYRTDTIRPLHLSQLKMSSSQNCHCESESLSETDPNLFQQLNFQESKLQTQSDWSGIVGEKCEESALRVFVVVTPTELANPRVDYDQFVSPELEDLMVQDNPPTDVLSDDLQLHTWNYGTLQEQSSPVTTHERSCKRTKETKAATSKHLMQIERQGKVLKRNRIAATKYYQKRKEWTTGLKDKSRDLQQERNRLCRLVTSMKSELLYLKSEILMHSMCNNPGIRTYLNFQASKLAGYYSLSEST